MTANRDEYPGSDVEEAYIHCAKHIPKLSIDEFEPPWGTGDEDLKKAGFVS